MTAARDPARGAAAALTSLRLEADTSEGRSTHEAQPGDAAITIGRGADDNRLVLRDKTVSRRHAVVEHTPDGWRVRDLGSMNGVKLRGRPLPEGGAVLADGDELQLGLVVVHVRLAPLVPDDDGPPTLIEPAPRERPVEIRPAPRPSPPAARPAAPPPPPPPSPPAAPSRERRPAPTPHVIDRFARFDIVHELTLGDDPRLALALDGGSTRVILLRAADPGFFGRRRFRRAHEAARALSHPNLLAPVEVGHEGDSLWVAYPFVDGVTAGTVLREGRRDLRVEVAAWVVLGVCRGLDHVAATLGADVLPAVATDTVLVGRDGEARLVFHVAPGPARYRAPEEESGGHVDARAGVFAAGILLYELLVREPIEASQKLTLASVDTVRLQVPRQLAETTMRAVEIRPEDRFPSAAAMADALEEALRATAPALGAADVGAWIAQRFPN